MKKLFERIYSSNSQKNSYKKIALIYIGSFLLSIITWNFIIGNFVFNQSAILFDDVIGNRRYPNTKFLGSAEGHSNFFTDELGFNNKKISEKRNDKIRIIILGDSTTEAEQVNLDKSYASLLEKKLNESSRAYEIFNLGFSGRAIPDYISYADGYIEKFSPDFFIIQINYDDFTSDATGKDKQNYIRVNQENNLEIVHNTHAGNETNRMIYDKSGWFQPIVAYTVTNVPISNPADIFKKPAPKTIEDPNSWKKTLTENAPALIEWQLAKIQEKYGNKIAFIYTSTAPSIHDGKIAENEDPTVIEIKELIQEKCAKLDIPLIDTSDQFVSYYKQTGKMPRGFANTMPGGGHLNEGGHQIVAKMLEEFVKNNQILSKQQ